MNRGIKVLQTFALPLGSGTVFPAGKRGDVSQSTTKTAKSQPVKNAADPFSNQVVKKELPAAFSADERSFLGSVVGSCAGEERRGSMRKPLRSMIRKG